MLSIKRLGKAGQARKSGQSLLEYYKEVELNRKKQLEYYLNKHPNGELAPELKALLEQTQARWVGKAAEHLGLKGTISEFKDFDKLLCGKAPSTFKEGGKFGPDKKGLVRGAGEHHQMGQDLTFSLQKPVTLVTVLETPERRQKMFEIYQSANEKVMGFLESYAKTRTGAGGIHHEKVDGIASAFFTHFASRELDPQIHFHGILFNVGLRQDGQFGTLESKTFYEMKMLAGALWRAEIGKGLLEMGYDLEYDSEKKNNFRIKGISEEISRKFSTRRAQIEEELARVGKSGAKASQQATMATRRAKDEPGLHELLPMWRQAAADMGLTLDKIKTLSQDQAIKKDFEIDEDELFEKLTDDKSTFGQWDIARKIAEITAPMGWGMDQILAKAEEYMKSERVLRLEKERVSETSVQAYRYTTQEQWAMEKLIDDGIQARRNETAHHVDKALTKKVIDSQPINLNQEQREAVEWICHETGGVCCVEGWAGTGKTTMLKTVNEVLTQAGFKAIGTALAGKAAEGLEKEAGIESRTIDSLLSALKKDKIKLDSQTFVIVDEAGMVGSKHMRELQRHVDAVGAKLVLVGDPKQLQPVKAGGIMRSIMRDLGKAELSSIQRQKTNHEELKKAALDKDSPLSQDQRKEVEALWKSKASDRGSKLQALMQGWGQLNKKVGEVLNEWIETYDYEWMRKTVKGFAAVDSQGKNHASVSLRELHAKNLVKFGDTARETCEGLVEEWFKDKHSIQAKLIMSATNEENYLINNMIRDRLKADGVIGKEDHKVFESKTSSVFKNFSENDRVIFTMNNRKIGVKNGTFGFIEGIKEKDGVPHLTVRLDGDPTKEPRRVEVNTKDYPFLRHGYCVTVHKSQGATVDTAYMIYNENVNRELTYVANSRTRYATKVYAVNDDISHHLTDEDMELGKEARAVVEEDLQLRVLGERMERSDAKDTTLDYVNPISGAALEVLKKAHLEKEKEAGLNKFVKVHKAAKVASNDKEVAPAKGKSPTVAKDVQEGKKPGKAVKVNRELPSPPPVSSVAEAARLKRLEQEKNRGLSR